MSNKSLTQVKIDGGTPIVSMEKLGEQHSSASFFAAKNTHEFVDYNFSIEDRLKARGEFEVELVVGYDLKKVKVKVKDGQVQLKNGQWIDAITGFKSFRNEIQRANERESWRNMSIASMDDKIAIATIIGSSRKASKRAEKKKLEKLEKLLKINEDYIVKNEEEENET